MTVPLTVPLFVLLFVVVAPALVSSYFLGTTFGYYVVVAFDSPVEIVLAVVASAIALSQPINSYEVLTLVVASDSPVDSPIEFVVAAVAFAAVLSHPVTSYEVRPMGDASAAAPELCQVWSVNLSGVDIHSSRCAPRPQAATDASSSGGGGGGGNSSSSSSSSSRSPSVLGSAVRQVGSRLLRNGDSSPGDVSVEVSWRTRRTFVGVGDEPRDAWQTLRTPLV